MNNAVVTEDTGLSSWRREKKGIWEELKTVTT